jgi:peptide/nickel transport system substrate-binding protein
MRLIRRRHLRISTVGLGIAFAAVTLTCTGGATPTRLVAKKNVVHLATALTIPTIDGIISNSIESTHQIYDTLAGINGQGGLTHNVATSWESNTDGTRWTFTIRKNVKCQDGSTLTPQDVVWTFQKVINTPTSLVRTNVFPFLDPSGVTTGPNNTVVFNLKVPSAVWPRQTSLVPLVPQHAYESLGPDKFAQTPVGCGPFQVLGYDPGKRLVLKAFKDYWAGRPAFGYVTEDVVTDETARLNALRSGEIDAAVLSPITAGEARKDKMLIVKAVPSNLVTYIGFNVQNPSLINPNLRKAVAMAIDRNAIAKNLYGGDATPTGCLLAPVTFGYDPNAKPTEYNPTQAKALVQQSGYNGQALNLNYPNGPALPGADQLAQAVAGYLQAVGINVNLIPQEQTTFIADWLGRRFTGLYLFSFQPSTLDGQIVYNLLVNSANYATDTNVTQLFQQQSAQPNVKQRNALLRDLGNRLVQQDVWFTPLIVNGRVYAWNPSKVRLTPRADGYMQPQFFKLPLRTKTTANKK